MGRTPCCDKNGLNKGPWAPEEDRKLIQYIQMHGPRNWRTLPNNAGLRRCGKSCRLRWANYLRPDIKRGRFSFEEEETIIQLHSSLGNKWSAIAARLPGRTDNEIKNYWNTHIRKRLVRSGIDPVTHAPRLDLLQLSTLFNSPQPNHSNPFLGNFNVSNLILLQALLNPEALKLALNLLPSNSNPNLDILLQKLQENNSNLFNNSQKQSPNLFSPIPSNLSNQRNSDSTQGHNTWRFSTEKNSQILQENDLASNSTNTNESHPTTFPDSQSLNRSCSNNFDNNNLSFNSLWSTYEYGQSSHLDSASTGLMAKEKTDDERDCFLSRLTTFEVPEILDFDDLM